MIAIHRPAADSQAFAPDEFRGGGCAGLGLCRSLEAIGYCHVVECVDQNVYLDFHWGYANGKHLCLLHVE
jgi:hypothetical protein